MALIGVTTAVITANIEKRSVMSQKIKFVKLWKRWKRPLCQKSAVRANWWGDISTGLLWWLRTNPSKIDLDLNINKTGLVKRSCMESSEHNKRLMTGHEGNKIYCFPSDQSLSDLLCNWKFWSWKFIKPRCNGGHRSTFAVTLHCYPLTS